MMKPAIQPRFAGACGRCRAGIGIRRWLALAPLLLGCAYLNAAAADVHVDADFPGGNARVLHRDGSTFTLAPDLRDTQGWWFFFHFRLRAPAGQPVTIRFSDPNPIGVRGPAMSLDGGRTWEWLGRNAVRRYAAEDGTNWTLQATVPQGASEVRYAFAPTYGESHLRDWLARHRASPALQVSELCRTRKGRPVELLRAGCLDATRTPGIVLLTSRHHACESMATYVLEGLLSAVLAGDELGRRWRERWQIVALPFADKDGVEDGDQGKNRAPHDHNRDYNAAPLYPEVAAWMKLGHSIQDRVAFSLDLHCPHIRGAWNDRVYIVGTPSAEAAGLETQFARVLERVCRGPLPFRAADCYLPAGVAWNQSGNYQAGRSNGRWARECFPAARFAGTMEVAYADAFGVEVNVGSARAFGRDLVHAIAEYLDADVPPARKTPVTEKSP